MSRFFPIFADFILRVLIKRASCVDSAIVLGEEEDKGRKGE